MKRVMHVITGLETGGAEMMLYKLLSLFDRSKIELSVVSLQDKGTIGARIDELGIPLYFLNMRRTGIPSLSIFGNIARLVRKTKPDVIQGWMYHGNIAATYASFFCGRPPVCWNIRQTLYSLSHEKNCTALMIRLGKLLSKKPEVIVFNSSESLRQHIEFGYLEGKSLVIPNGFDTDLFSPDPHAATRLRSELNLPENSTLIGMIARYHPMKDHENFLHAASIVSKQNHRVRFVLAGKDIDNNNSKLRHIIRSLELNDKICLLGERNDMHRIYAGLDFVALSSAWGEGFPNVLGEAMSCGVPCVSTNIGDSALVTGDTGVIVLPENSHDLARGLLLMINMSDEQKRILGIRARQRVTDNFSIYSIVAQYESLYHEIKEYN